MTEANLVALVQRKIEEFNTLANLLSRQPKYHPKLKPNADFFEDAIKKIQVFLRSLLENKQRDMKKFKRVLILHPQIQEAIFEIVATNRNHYKSLH